MRYALLLLLLAPCAAPAVDCLHNWMQCPADSSLDISGFAARASDVIQSITRVRNEATERLTAHKITVEQAKAVLRKTGRARVLWNQAVAACKMDARTGHCDNAADDVGAYALLDWAQRSMR